MTEATTSAGTEGRLLARGEEVFEHLVREHVAPVIGQEGLDTAVGHELAAQSGGVEQLTVGIELCPCTCQFSTIGSQIAVPSRDCLTVS